MIRKRVKAIVILVLVWIIAFIGIVSAWQNRERNVNIVEAFAAESYLNTNGCISVYANYGNAYLSEEEKEEIIKKILGAINIEGDINIRNERQSENGGKQAIITTSYATVTERTSTDARIVTIENYDSDSKISLEQYILMELSIDNSIESIVHYEKRIRDKFQSLNIPADVTLKLKGCVKGALSNIQKNKICEDILDRIGGKIVIGSRDEDYYRVYAYTDEIEDYVLSGSTRTNINMEIYYDRDNDVTWINVGTPMLNE